MIRQYIETGKIVGTHGIRGMVRVQLWADSSDFLRNFSYVYLDDGGQKRLEIKTVQPHGNVVLLAFQGVDTVEGAEALRGKTLYIRREDVTLPEGRYFITDLIGCTVYDCESGKKLGELSDVSQTGANDVWHITKDGREYLLPAIEEVIVAVDPAGNEIQVRPMKGIFDDED